MVLVTVVWAGGYIEKIQSEQNNQKITTLFFLEAQNLDEMGVLVWWGMRNQELQQIIEFFIHASSGVIPIGSFLSHSETHLP